MTRREKWWTAFGFAVMAADVLIPYGPLREVADIRGAALFWTVLSLLAIAAGAWFSAGWPTGGSR